jgi:hypothetical protein
MLHSPNIPKLKVIPPPSPSPARLSSSQAYEEGRGGGEKGIFVLKGNRLKKGYECNSHE